MDSRQRILSVVAGETPDRVPMWCGASVEFWAKAKSELSLEDDAHLAGLTFVGKVVCFSGL